MIDKITVYILTYNRPDYLAQCLASLREQTYKRFKTVVLDNCSVQNLNAVITEYTDLNIEYIKHKQNLGSTGNFSYAWKQIKSTEYFVIFHDDDLMHPRFLEVEAELLETNQHLVWVASNSIAFKDKSPPWKVINEITPMVLGGAELAFGLISGLRLGLTFSSVMYRSNTIDKIDLDNLFHSHSIIFDRPILFELVTDAKCVLIPQPLILYRCHDKQDSKTGPVNLDNLQELLVSYKKLLMTNWTTVTQKKFYAWSGFTLIDAYLHTEKDKKPSLTIYLQKAKRKEIYDDFIFYYYLCGFIKFQHQVISRGLNMLITNPVKFAHLISGRFKTIKLTSRQK